MDFVVHIVTRCSIYNISSQSIATFKYVRAGPHSAVSNMSDSGRARGPGFNTRSGHILPFLFPLVQERQLLY